MSIRTGTPEHEADHAPGLAALGVGTGVGIPALLAIVGLAVRGWGAIDWLGAVVWGVVATLCFTAAAIGARSAGLTRLDLADLFGSAFARPGTPASRRIGLVAHQVNGALLAIAWAYATALVRLPADWRTGLAWGLLIALLSLLLLTTLGALHPAVRRREQDDPGWLATNFGRRTPWVVVAGHLIYGLVLGLLYQLAPLS